MSMTANKPTKKKILQFDPSLYNIEVDYGVIEVCKVDIIYQISQQSINTMEMVRYAHQL